MTILTRFLCKILGYVAVVLTLFFSLNGFGNSIANAAMATVENIRINNSAVIFEIDSPGVEFDYYTLGAPSRLVVDIKEVLPAFETRNFVVANGFSAIRVGIYSDKTRFVFDCSTDKLPELVVDRQGNNVIVDWSGKTDKLSVKPRVEIPVSVSSINFDVEDGISKFVVNFDGDFDLIDDQIEDGIIRFGAKDAVIPRSLRRVVDASVFPSSVLQITPYSTIISGQRNVMFSAKMKGPVEYNVIKKGLTLEFQTVDGVFSETAPASVDTVYVPVKPLERVAPFEGKTDEAEVDDVSKVLSRLKDAGGAETLLSASTQPVPKLYTGEPVTLVLDDADIRKVMQLVAEVSNLNIILSDDVQGNVSLRLHDVPWDQALDLILDIKELGTITQGNVVRVLPLKTIKDMEAARLRAHQEIKQLEATVTEIFTINYKDATAIEDVIEDVLSNQGEAQVIEGSKKIMVNDIPSKIEEVRQLIFRLDEPVKQVLIEARIVEANTDATQTFGIHWGFNYSETDSSGGLATIGDASVGIGGAFTTPNSVSAGLGSALTFGLAGVDSATLDFNLSALETAGEGKVISSPKVLALDGETARIGQGQQIPYKTTSDEGTTTEFKKAELALEVTPLVNPDNTVLLEILATNSTPGVAYDDGVAINTKEAETKLLLKSGETTVIGGIYTENTQDGDSGTPILKDIPILGYLFKAKTSSNERTELLVFITPHIIE